MNVLFVKRKSNYTRRTLTDNCYRTTGTTHAARCYTPMRSFTTQRLNDRSPRRPHVVITLMDWMSSAIFSCAAGDKRASCK